MMRLESIQIQNLAYRIEMRNRFRSGWMGAFGMTASLHR